MNLTTLTLTLALTGLLATANAQERLAPEKAKHYAQLTRQKPEALKGAALQFKADLEHPIALANGDHGGLLIPRAGLADLTPSDYSATPTAIGELWLYNLTLQKDGVAVPEAKLNVVPLKSNQGEVKIPRCILAVSLTSDDTPVLQVYGKDKTPVLTVPIRETGFSSSDALNMTATADGEVTLSKGGYTATFQVDELFIW